MRLTAMPFRTLRDEPAEASAVSHRLLLRAGLAVPVEQGAFGYLPLGWRALARIEAVVGEAMRGIAAHEVGLPVATATGDALAPSAASQLLAAAVRSYRQLPARCSGFVHELRPEARSRGLLGLRDARLAIGLAADADMDAAGQTYLAVGAALDAICGRLGVELVAADTSLPGQSAQVRVLLDPGGDETLVHCPSCGFRAGAETARIVHPAPAPEAALPQEEIETPGTTTIAALAAFLGVGAERTAKAAFFADETGRLITAIVRGDFEVSEPKLVQAAGVHALRPATIDEIRASGMEPGYGSPVGAHDTLVVVDAVAAASPNLVAGANRVGFHICNVNVGRDFAADLVADVAASRTGDPCPVCGVPVELERATSVATVRTTVGTAAAVEFLAADGTARRVVMTGWSIEIERLLAAVLETHHDEKGIRWPAAVAPFAAQLVTLGASRPEVREAADELYGALVAAGLEPLYDDRDETAGVKLTDAELIGLPVIVTVSPRSLGGGGAEVTVRGRGERSVVAMNRVVAAVAAANRS